MENNIEIFNKKEFGEVRATSIDGEAYLMLADVCRVLGIKNSRQAKTRLSEKGVINLKVETNGGIQKADFIDKKSLFELISNSSKFTYNKKIELFNHFGIDEKILKKERKEVKFIELLEEFLSEYNIKGIKQYPVFNYRIDYYIPELKLAIEYDEDNHKHYTYKNQELRQLKIKNELNCKFIRLSDSVSDIKNIAKVSKHLKDMEVKNE